MLATLVMKSMGARDLREVSLKEIMSVRFITEGNIGRITQKILANR
jgi:hypothetical protein